MKKAILILSIILITGSLYAQRRGGTIKWLSLSVKAGGGNSLLYNKDIQTDPDINLDFFSPSYFFGSRFTISIGDNIGFGGEGLYSKFGQNYSIVSGGGAYKKKLDFNATDFLLFFRYTSDYGGYFEIGPKFSRMKSASLENSITSNEFVPIEDLQAKFSEQYTSIMVGAGVSLFRTDRVTGKLGARLAYSTSDFTPEKSFSVINDGVYVPPYTISATTNPFTIQGVLEINYFFGFWGDASCGRGSMQLFK